MPNETTSETLLERDELEGKHYPLYIERAVFIILLFLAIFSGKWMWDNSELNRILLWVITIVILPIAVLIFTECFGRALQKIRSRD